MKTLNKPNLIFAIGFPILIFLVCCAISTVPLFSSNKLINTGIALDLTITAPVIYYLFILKTSVSKLTVTRVFIIGVCFASYLLHRKNVFYLETLKEWIVPIIEILTIVLVAYRFNVDKKAVKKDRFITDDFLINCRNILTKVIGNEKIVAVLASEFAVVYYTFVWRKYAYTNNGSSFSYYKRNNTRLVICIFMILILIETIASHFLFSIWSKRFAWIFTSLSIYTCIQLFAHVKAMKHRPVRFIANKLFLCNGLAGDAVIAIDNIEQIVLFNKKLACIDFVSLALLKRFEKPNIILNLKEPIEVTRFFGIKLNTSTILFSVDDPNELISTIKIQMVS